MMTSLVKSKQIIGAHF